MDNLQSDNTNLNNNNKGPFLIFILSNPRSLSTVYLRTFMNAENILILSDQFTKIHIEDVQVNGSKLSMMELSKDLETKIESSLKENKTVIFKDNANFTLLYFSETPKTNLCFFQKDDRPRNYANRNPIDFLETSLKTNFYIPLWELFSKFKGKVVIVEDLQENPTKVFKESFEYCGIPFKEEVLTYEPMIKVGVPDEMKYFQNWYVDCISSTTLRPGVTDISKIVIDDEEANERIKISEEYYMKFIEESKKQK